MGYWPQGPVCYAETGDMRRLRSVPAAFFLALFLVLVAGDTLQLSAIELASAPYRYDLVGWEIAHLPDKWFHKLESLLPWNSSTHEERLADLRKYFRLGEDIRRLEGELERLQVRSSLGTAELAEEPDRATDLSEQLNELWKTRSAMRAGVEETLESEVGKVLSREGLKSWIGLLFPPVDVSLTRPPRVLVVSPRDTIVRSESILLDAGIDVEAMEALESKLFREQDLAALVVGIGGVATYPNIVRDDTTLRSALGTSAHEWLHTYWFFRPLGWNIFSSPDMNTLNETAADLAGDELGDLVFEAVTGEKINDPPPGPPPEDDPDRFDFNTEMRETRLEVDRLLGEGKIVEAEEYMEQRRRVFVENRFSIRKLNQAYFAFNGTYASNPASVSPIGGQVEAVRASSGSVGDFIRTMSGFGNIEEFLDHVSGLPDADVRAAAPTEVTQPVSWSLGRVRSVAGVP